VNSSVDRSANRLAGASSPYLRQHADNPVHWQPWDDAALADARERDVPILLSVGYSSCHWCHVMAHESFEDPSTADVMNAHFVCIKVDREERPDLDRVYQTTHQILTRQPGGWPLTVFLDPRDHVPFFSGTYFPRTPRMGMPGFVDLLQRVASVWAEQRDALSEQGAKVQQILNALNEAAEGDPALPDAALLDAAREQLGKGYDASDGGFGDAPKFPMAGSLERLLRHWAASGKRDGDALEMVMHTLTRMARGGIFDHLGGGFCRYATDRAWVVPHFEKMLYDNGALLGLYADALSIAPDPLLETVVRDTADWLLREMQASEGGFYAALDADSEGEEGRFYVWHREQIRRALDDDEYRVLATLYGVDKPANFEGSWILHRRDAWRAVVERLDLDPADAEALLASGRAKLLALRDERERPERDEKVLAAWNGLAIGGLARAARVTGDERWLSAAQTAADFLREAMVEEGRLYASWTGGQLGARAYLEDHALVLEGVLELLQSAWRDVDARFAVELADALLQHFMDPEQGGFYQTAHDAEPLIHRPRPTMDEALPGGSAAAARGLQRLGQLMGRQDYADAARRALEQAAPFMARAPQAHGAMLDTLAEYLEPPEQILIRGPEASTWARSSREGYRPDRRVFAITDASAASEGTATPVLPAYLPETPPETTTAWICRGGTCSLPITSRDGLDAELGGARVVQLRPR
jgi:uncharacterized protein YyaL (SSP411 family)